MGKGIIMHVDEAPFLYGGPTPKGGPRERGGRFIGDLEKGPWIHCNTLEAGTDAAPHSHDFDEVMLVIEGEFSMGNRVCGPGTVLFLAAGTQYGFKVGPEGVRFLNVRTGKATITSGGKTWNPYHEPKHIPS